jgi:hypothetical protein
MILRLMRMLLPGGWLTRRLRGSTKISLSPDELRYRGLLIKHFNITPLKNGASSKEEQAEFTTIRLRLLELILACGKAAEMYFDRKFGFQEALRKGHEVNHALHEIDMVSFRKSADRVYHALREAQQTARYFHPEMIPAEITDLCETYKERELPKRFVDPIKLWETHLFFRSNRAHMHVNK